MTRREANLKALQSNKELFRFFKEKYGQIEPHLTTKSLIHYHSQVITLTPGDVISTGTPGATPIQDGDEVECRIGGFEPLRNPVIDLKLGAR